VTDGPPAGYLAVLSGDGRPTEGAQLRRGQFHDVVLIGDLAYRFPRGPGPAADSPRQAGLLLLLAASGLPVAVPQPVASTPAGRPHSQSYLAVRRLPGQPLAGQLPAAASDACLSQLCELLDRLHELGASPAVRELVPGPDPRRWQQFADQVAAVLFPLMSADGRRRAGAELTGVLAAEAGGNALVHGDLGGANLLWQGSGPDCRLAGVIDWDEAHIGSQADDLASIAVTIGWTLAARIDAARNAGSPAIADARAIAATFALQQALPAALTGDTESLDDGLASYR
jgi:aminoglycoside phosphotransferase (APT) family kinase protein